MIEHRALIVNGLTTVRIPEGANLSLRNTIHGPCLMFSVDDQHPYLNRTFKVVKSTDYRFKESDKYIGSVSSSDSDIVWVVVEVFPWETNKEGIAP